MTYTFTAVPDSDVVVVQHRWVPGGPPTTVVLREVTHFQVRRDTVHYSARSKQDHLVLVHCEGRTGYSAREFHFETEDEARVFAISLSAALGWTS